MMRYNVAYGNIETTLMAWGTHGIIYTCETDDISFTGSSDVPYVPNKLGKACFCT